MVNGGGGGAVKSSTCGAGCISYLEDLIIKLKAKRGADFASCANKSCGKESYTSVRANQNRLMTS